MRRSLFLAAAALLAALTLGSSQGEAWGSRGCCGLRPYGHTPPMVNWRYYSFYQAPQAFSRYYGVRWTPYHAGSV